MRSIAAFGVALALSGTAYGADYLRGTQDPPYAGVRAFTWEGSYVGAHAAYNSANFDAARQSIDLETQALAGTIVQPNMAGLFRLGKVSEGKFSGGIFFGHNWQFEDVVYGLEGEINIASLTGTQSRTNFGTFLNLVPNTFTATPAMEPAGTFTDAATNGTSTNKIRDYAIVKARAGYAMGRIMPYLSLGIGVARVENTANATLTFQTTQIVDNYNTVLVGGVPTRTTFINQTNYVVPQASGIRVVASKDSAYKAGVALGLGVDWSPFDNFFLRAEYQALLLTSFEKVDFQIHSARVGGGVKF